MLLRHTSSSSLAEQTYEEETVARSGDAGLSSDFGDSDPWSTGEIDNLRTKWLHQELVNKELGSSGRIASLQRRSSRSLRRISVDEQNIEIGLDYMKREPERVYGPDLALSPLSDTPGLSPLSDTALVPESTLIGQSYRQQTPQSKEERHHKLLTYFSILTHLAFFGIVGVLIRYWLGILFHDVLSVTHEGTLVYKDLPANVVGSFFMGWVGVVLKKDILLLSEPMAIGLSTGLMGSITTYAAWNQSMVALLTIGDVATTFSGLLLGMAIAQMSLLAGIDSARGLKSVIGKCQQKQTRHDLENINKSSPVSSHFWIVSLVVIAFATACLWGAAFALLIRGRSSRNLRILWLACLVAPPGVWTRWLLARFNGKGVGGRLKWLPVGTLLANLTGASLEAVLALLLFVVPNQTAALLIGGLQLGFLGCLSTVSTFVAEVYTMHEGPMRLKAYTYTILTLGLGLALCIILYSCPAWRLGYVKW
eukprot:c12253_g1_i4 orf=257-1693(+)